MYVHEEESLGRGGAAGCFTVAGGEDVRDGVRGELFLADVEQGAGDVAHHLVEEAVPFEFEAEA